MRKSLFPKDFLWGASTSAHQVEGNTHNQWSEWEVAQAERLAAAAEKRLSWLPNWEAVKAAATDPQNYISGRAVEHYERYKDDFKLLKQLNMNAYRFSIEWSRVEPREGEWDEKQIAHYREYIAELKRQSIEPVLTLWHWTMPTWFTDKGGFEKRANVRYFERFAAKVATDLGGGLRYILTLNEPNSYASQSYAVGCWPPERRNIPLTLYVYYNLTLAHKRAYVAWKSIRPKAQVSVAMTLADIRPRHPRNLLERLVCWGATYGSNWWFINRIRHHLDFVGVNFYFAGYVSGVSQHNPKAPVSDLGWYMEPSGIANVLVQAWHRYRKPVIVIENGLADAVDSRRKWWIEETLGALERALEAGVDLRGYFHWSLLDNFEWAYGWWPKFGLIAVDRKTQRRTIRSSATWLAQKVKQL